jgi:hypothetical protein
MGDSEQQILKMLSDGIITADEASELLRTMNPNAEDHDSAPEGQSEGHPSGTDEVLEGEIITPGSRQPPPELLQIRRYWYIPTSIAVGSSVLSGAGLFLLYQSDNPAFLGFFCLWGIFLMALMASLLLLMSHRSTWLYLNVEERGGRHIRFALPLPLGFVHWIVRIVRPFLPRGLAPYLDTAATFVKAMRDNPDSEPIMINVDEGTGEKVQIFIG